MERRVPLVFTGLVQRTGKIVRVSRGRGLTIEVRPDDPWAEEFEQGESIAVNGVCLTVSQFGGGRFAADVLAETERRSTLASLAPGARVNLERAMRADGRFGGHVVQGHVDGTGTVTAVVPSGRDFALVVSCGPVVAAATVEKGSIAVDGVSLTVSALGRDWFRADVTPSTAAHTTLASLRPGMRVNIESDILGRYARRQAEFHAEADAPGRGGLTFETLAENGFA